MKRISFYFMIMATATILYMVIFLLVFLALFRGSMPSFEIIMLNFIMVLVILLSLPALNELMMYLRTLVFNHRVDTVYIIKKLSQVSPTKVDLKELANFLAKQMHFKYIGFLIDGKLYGSMKGEISAEGIKLVSGLGKPERGAWQEFNEDSYIWQKMDCSAVAALRDGRGRTFGQMIVGKPTGKVDFNDRDLVQVETIVNLVALIIDAKGVK